MSEAAAVEVVLVTAPDEDVARSLAHALVAERLAACVNVLGGVRSVYRWEGAVQDDGEVLLVVKTRSDRAGELARRVTELHPYDVPEVVRLRVEGGSARYLEWVLAESTPGAGGAPPETAAP